eukprot:TRINITY_DN24127_c0_g1_i2.p1 TRINITY_DN24127_c0_g1~~TRINITY_DN24127_c0_g1_i2.p1  ORF type:complete len:350 (+),score=52.52 TRINITY_DN24127_c0_g1_i2:144-1193(+)
MSFHFVLMCTLLGHKSADPRRVRTQVQNGLWFIKLLLFVAVIVSSYFIPNSFFSGYAQACKWFSFLWIVIQVVILIDWAFGWNESWVDKEWYKGLLAVSITIYITTFTLIVLSYVWFSKGSECGTYTFLITFIFVLCLVITAMSVKIEHGALLPAAIVSIYCVYYTWSALMAGSGKVESAKCNGLTGNTGAQTWSLILGMLFTAASLGYSSYTAGTSMSTFSTKEEEKPKFKSVYENPELESNPSATVEQPLNANKQDSDEPFDEDYQVHQSYNYSFFHFMFALAAMYMSMLMTGWGDHSTSSAYNTYEVNGGAVAFWVRIVSAWVTILVYIWALIAPMVLKNREFSHA